MISLVRVDNRLLHGQILETWVPRLKIARVVVVDEEAAASPLARAAMTLCLPPELSAEVVAPGRMDYAALAAAPAPVLILLREVGDLARAVADGLSPSLARTVNLGNVHYAAGRRPVTPSVFLSAEELAAVLRLEAAGFEVEARAVPSEAPASARDLARNYDAGAEKR